VGQPRAAREYISVADYHGLIDLLMACAVSLPRNTVAAGPLKRFDKLWADLSRVL